MSSFSPFIPKNSNVFTFTKNSSDSSPFKHFTSSPHTDASTKNSFSSPSSTCSSVTFFPQIPSFSPASNASTMPNLPPISNLSTNSVISLQNTQSQIKEPSAPLQTELTSFLLNWKIQQNLQAEVMKAQMQQLVELENSLLNKKKQLHDQQNEKDSNPQLNIPILIQTNSTNTDNAGPKSSIKKQSPKEIIQKPLIQCSQNIRKTLKNQIKDIIIFVLDNFGRINETSFDSEKLRYQHDKDLEEVFEIIGNKYASTIKTKEEMVKYTLRRALKFIKNNLKKEMNANTKGVSKTLCDKYFKASEDEILKMGNEEDFLKVVLPFRKNSKNKTMNTSFIGQMFSSKDFCKDYDTYLQNFDKILEEDNKSKIDRLTSYVEECIKKKKIKDIKHYKRIPWPKLWIVNTKKIAQELPYNCNPSDQCTPPLKKKTKICHSANAHNESN